MTEFPDTRASLLAAVKSPENCRAWDDFVTLYRPTIYRMARRRGLQDADAQDVTQNILARVAGAMPRYESQHGIKFRHWLRRVAKNAILTSLASPHRDKAVGGTAVHDLLAEHPDADPDVERELDKEYEREQYLRAAAIVRADVALETWQAFEMTVIEGQACEAVSEAMGKSIGTIYAARSRIVKRLREQIDLLEGLDR